MFQKIYDTITFTLENQYYWNLNDNIIKFILEFRSFWTSSGNYITIVSVSEGDKTFYYNWINNFLK